MPSTIAKLSTEFIGTFFLVLTIGVSVQTAGAMAPLAIGLMLIALVYFGGHVSGAQYNPAVTLAVFVRGKMPATEIPGYLIAQLVAAGAGAAAGSMLTGKQTVPAPGAGVSLLTAAAAETLFTFALAIVILNVATVKRTSGNSYYGVAIGLTVLAAALTIGPVSGAVLNPAVGFGLCVIAGKFEHLPLYIIAPLGGGLLAGLAYRIQAGERD